MEFVIFTAISDDKIKDGGIGLDGVCVTNNDMRNTFKDAVEA
jgi:hypothetical protein